MNKQTSALKNVIEVKGLKKSFNGNVILSGIDFHLKKGENLVVLGRSGVGKSVLIKCLIRLYFPDDGTLNILDYPVEKIDDEALDEFRRKVGFLFQGGALYDSMNVEDNLKFPLRRMPSPLSESGIEDRVQEGLVNVDLEDARFKMPSELSGGMKKRIALARTLILHPEIMLYDEPTTGLDSVTSKEISDLILKMQDRYQMSSVIITHDMSCARITANRIKVLMDGVFKAAGTYDELSHSEVTEVREFFN